MLGLWLNYGDTPVYRFIGESGPFGAIAGQGWNKNRARMLLFSCMRAVSETPGRTVRPGSCAVSALAANPATFQNRSLSGSAAFYLLKVQFE